MNGIGPVKVALIFLTLALGISGCAKYDKSAEAMSPASDLESKQFGGAAPIPSPTDSISQTESVGKLTRGEGEAAIQSEVAEGQVSPSRMIIYEAFLGVQVSNVEVARRTTEELAKRLGGYVEASGMDNVVIRIPAGKAFDDAIAEIEGLGTLSSRNITSQDVTEEFADLQIRLENLQELRERYLAHLREAKKMEDVIQLEQSLANLTLQIEQIEGRLRLLQSRVSFSKITVNFGVASLANVGNMINRERFNPPPEGAWVKEISLGNVLSHR